MRSPRPRATLARLAVGLALLAAGVAGLGRGPAPAGAAVQQVSGYRATVLGWSSWYGSYGLGTEGTAWCIDHGIRAPDPALRYVRTTLTGVPATTQTAMAWAFGRYGPGADRTTSAALMLVGHDLMGARYPHGRMDVTALTERSIAGFGADGPAVLARARAIRADAVARSGLRGPWRLTIATPPTRPGARGTGTVRITAGGTGSAGVPGITVTVASSGASVVGPATVTTRGDGTARFTFTAGAGAARFTASARVPDLALQVFAPTAARAQRVVRAASLDLRAAVEQAPPTTTTVPPPTTTSTTTPTTTTSTTTTSTTTTSTTAPPTATTTTEAPTTTSASTSTSTTSTAVPEVPPASVPPPVPAVPSTTTSTTGTSTTVAPPPAPVAPPPPQPPALPRTGEDPAPLAATGAGLVLLGTSLPRPGRRPRVK